MELPSYVQIEPVGQCNLRCQMCPIQFRQDGPPYGPPAFMDFDMFSSIIDQYEGQLRDLHLQGLGEPMMHPRYFDMVRYAAGKGIKVTTNSNLTLLNSRRAEQCVTSGLETLHVSLDGSTAETYERIRVRAHYDRVIRNLELLMETRARLGSELPHVKMVMVIMRQNLHELPDLVRLAHRLGVEALFVQHLCHDFGESSLPANYKPMRDFVDDQTLLSEDPERVEHYFGEAKDVAKELGFSLRLPRTHVRAHPPGTPGRKRCDWPWAGAYYSYQGYTMPCCMISTPDRLNFGKVDGSQNGSGHSNENSNGAAHGSVLELWESADFQAFRDRLDSDDPPEICKSCAVYNGTF